MPRRLLAAAAMLALAPAAAAHAAPRNGAIAYVGDVGGVTNLLAREGDRVRGILEGNTLLAPAWSPRGGRLAVARTTGSGRALWVVDADGRGARQLTPSAGLAAGPSWAPDGDEIAYAEGRAGRRRLYAVMADGTTRRRLTGARTDERDPAWSVRGQIAYVVRTRRGDDLAVVAARGGRPRRLTRLPGDERSPAWSPDGRRLVFVRAGQLWTARADGSGRARVGAITRASEPAWSPDGRRLVFASGRPGRRRVLVSDLRGRVLYAVSRARRDGRAPAWQPAGFDPLVAAAGDIACDPASKYYNGGAGVPRRCGMARTSNLLLRDDYAQVLPLGDTQYADGAYAKFLASYGPTWGRTKSLQRPILGNHDYAGGAPDGYFDYFNGPGIDDGPAGSRAQGGYYSFDVGAWHVVALNSQCRQVPGGCGDGSPQQRWLAADLAAHPTRCTLALWHVPRFSSAGGGGRATDALWRTLQAAGADVVLSGHHRFYERFAPQTAAGVASASAGMRQFIVGTGGGAISQARQTLATSQRLIATTFGVLRLELRPTSYAWRFVSASADPATDSGVGRCR